VGIGAPWTYARSDHPTERSYAPAPDAGGPRALCAEMRRTIGNGDPDAVTQLLGELTGRVEVTPERATGALRSGGHRLAFRYIKWTYRSASQPGCLRFAT
jgi:hypothetical protein